MPTNRNICGNQVPKALRKREHRVWFEDNTTGVCSMGKRAERRMSDRLTSYVKAILEEQYGLRSGQEDDKIRTYVTKEMYPYGKQYDDQTTVTLEEYDTAGNTFKAADKLSEVQYREYLSKKPVHDTVTISNVAVLESKRVTHGHQQFSHTPLTDDDKNFSMVATTWKYDLFKTTFTVVEDYSEEQVGGKNYQSGIEITVELEREYKFFYDVWRFKSVTIKDYTGAAADKQPAFVKQFVDEVKAGKKNWGVAEDMAKYTKTTNPAK